MSDARDTGTSSGTASGPPARALEPAPPEKPSALKRWRRMADAVPDAADRVLVGDSLAAGWPAEPDSDRRVYNLGLPGDRIQNTLWRLGSAELSHLRPVEAVVLLGTNNLGDGDPPDTIAAGLAAVVAHLRALWPDARVIAFTVPRRGPSPGFREDERREANRLLLASLLGPAGPAVEVVDIDSALAAARLDPGAILGSDLLHLSHEGYRLLGDALASRLRSVPGKRRPVM